MCVPHATCYAAPVQTDPLLRRCLGQAVPPSCASARSPTTGTTRGTKLLFCFGALQNSLVLLVALELQHPHLVAYAPSAAARHRAIRGLLRGDEAESAVQNVCSLLAQDVVRVTCVVSRPRSQLAPVRQRSQSELCSGVGLGVQRVMPACAPPRLTGAVLSLGTHIS